ncbi:MAG: hypothetical protein ACK5SJ_08075 [Bacteroidota bacterium]|jgi:hypothetical protein|nr:hypothetical protein [Cytophagales bacterium]MCE2958775.1 hypothetical protein [Flammeovirgaceae bacterium]
MRFFTPVALGIFVCIASCSSHKEEKEEEFKFLATSPLKKGHITEKWLVDVED